MLPASHPPDSLDLSQLLQDAGGRLVHGSVRADLRIDARSVCTDSRILKRHDVFVALQGQRFDGHDYVAAAAANGAVAAIVHRPIREVPAGFPVIRVQDTVDALQRLAAAHRRRCGLTVIAVTGSNGKTTVKEMIAEILGGRYRVYRSAGNHNNQIGVALSLLECTPHHEIAVLELGMNAAGEIRRLARMADPQVGVITNIHHAHMGLLGTREAIMEAKAELIEILNQFPERWLVVNQDCQWTRRATRRARCRTLRFGRSARADVHMRLQRASISGISGVMTDPGSRSYPVSLPVPGAHNAWNLAAAAAAAWVLGVHVPETLDRLRKFRLPPLRTELERVGECAVISDCYNANPDSVLEALRLLKTTGAPRTAAILGDMLELEHHASFFHQRVGAYAADLGVTAIFAVGRYSEEVCRGARGHGLSRAYAFADKEQLVRSLSHWCRQGDCLMIKGSRGTHMEEVAERLKLVLCSHAST